MTLSYKKSAQLIQITASEANETIHCITKIDIATDSNNMSPLTYSPTESEVVLEATSSGLSTQDTTLGRDTSITNSYSMDKDEFFRFFPALGELHGAHSQGRSLQPGVCQCVLARVTSTQENFTHLFVRPKPIA